MSADEINDKIVAQGDKIRKMKADKEDKTALKPEIDRLLALKNDYKSATGKDWKPGAHTSGGGGGAKDEMTEVKYEGGGFTEEQKKALAGSASKALDIKIKNCGDYIRKLKSEKAEKDKVLQEVEVLKFLKGLYKDKAGKEWAPESSGGEQAGKAKENKKPNNQQQQQQQQGDGYVRISSHLLVH